MNTGSLTKTKIILLFCCLFGLMGYQKVQAQVYGPQQIKWLWVSPLRQYFSDGCSEIEYGRRGRGPYLNTDQCDGLQWPAQYQFEDHSVGKALWIGTTNFTDPSNGITYAYKVIPLGRLAMYINSAVFPVKFQLYGKFNHPAVVVDGQNASDLDSHDIDITGGEDVIDPNLPADRMIYNVDNTPIGITIYRKVYAFTQQYNNNYYIYDYVFKNTGLIDNKGGKISPPKTLTGVIFDFGNRFGNNLGYREGWAFTGTDWGLNEINDCIGQDAAHTLPSPYNFRATISYYGPQSASTGVQDDIGGPNFQDGHILGASSFVGEMVLHADKSTKDTSDDPNQPTTTQFIPSDHFTENISPNSPFDGGEMTGQYEQMTAGHPAKTQAEQIGEDANGWPTGFVNTWGSTTGGFHTQQAFGPYTIAPGDSIHIVLCEAVAGISQQKNEEVARKWWNWYNNSKSGNTELQLPNKPPFRESLLGQTPTWKAGGQTTDGNLYKNAWVFSGEDSLLQTFARARENYNNDFNIPEPPRPPDKFIITSGGNMITIQWSTSAESSPHFNGYLLYRAETEQDTTYKLIYSCDKGNLPEVVSGYRTYYDKSARRGFNYFYFVQTKDDGSTNNVQPGVPLVSSRFYTETNVAAHLTRPPGAPEGTNDRYNLSAIRIVPNPYNISARSIQFGTNITVQNRVAFYNLPPFCSIRIFTENGDLIKTIDHTNASGDEYWNLQTSSDQIIASGLYIAYFEVTQDYTDPTTNQVVYRKGQSIYKKMIIIR